MSTPPEPPAYASDEEREIARKHPAWRTWPSAELTSIFWRGWHMGQDAIAEQVVTMTEEKYDPVEHCRALLEGTGYGVYKKLTREEKDATGLRFADDREAGDWNSEWMGPGPEPKPDPFIGPIGRAFRDHPDEIAGFLDGWVQNHAMYPGEGPVVPSLGDFSTRPLPRPDTGKPDAWGGSRLWDWVFYVSYALVWAVVFFLIWRGLQ